MCCGAGRFVATAAVLVEDAFDQAGSLELVELPDPDAEHFTAGVIDLPFVELVFVHELEDEIPLLVGTGPAIAVGVAVAVPISVGGGAVAVGAVVVPVGGAVGFALHAVSVIRDEPRVLDLLVNALLERLIQARAFARHVVDVADLRLDADGILVT